MMKKSFIRIGACSAVVCGSLAYAATGQGIMMPTSESVASVKADSGVVVEPSDTSAVTDPVVPQPGKPQMGVSIGTVDVQPYADSGLNFSNFDATYVAKITDGTYMGFKILTSDTDSTVVAFTAINTIEEAVTIPDSIRFEGKVYPVSQIGKDYYTEIFAWTKVRELTIPASVQNITYSYMFSKMDAIYMLGMAPNVDGWISVNGKFYICDKNTYSTYAGNQYYENVALLPYGWDFDFMTVPVNRKGEFAQTYIEMTDADWAKGVYVKVTGELNEADLKNMRNLTALKKLDLSEAVFDKLPSSFMSNKETLIEVTLPGSLNEISSSAFSNCQNLLKLTAPGVLSIQNNAFGNCENLEDFDISGVVQIGSRAFRNCVKFNPTLPADLTTLESEAFSSTALKEVVLPQSITELKSDVFSDCTQLTKVTLPNTLTTIKSNCFNNCTALTDINLPEGMSSIGDGGFRNCSELTDITLPSTLQQIGYNVFTGCSALRTVKCKAVVPPSAGGDIAGGVDMDYCTLYVAPFALDAYRNAQGWGSFYIMKPLNEPVKNIFVGSPVSFDLQSADNAILQNNPNLTLSFNRNQWGSLQSIGELSAAGDGTLSAGVFKINHTFSRRNYADNDYRTTLINDAENMRADSVVCHIELEENTWHFISFQYDVQMADIQGVNNTDFVIREYNSQKRAAGESNNWEPVPADGVLKAGKGYIIQAANNQTVNGNSVAAAVIFPSRNTVTKNNLFTPNNIAVTLEEYPAEFAHNRSWNLVGNPYPCYFDLHHLMNDFITPIVLWRGSSYQAYSPIDDDVILRPNEAFFVQKPLDTDQMVFGASGRMHYSAARDSSNNLTPGIKNEGAARGNAARAVFNFNIEGGNLNDRARIVMNEEASMNYEMNRDAAKFFATEAVGAEIYVDGNVKYDICERPLGEGVATLGMRVGTAGEYTLSLSGRNMAGWTVMLTDTQTGTTVNLTETDYHFTAESGTAAERFVLTFENSQMSGVDAVETAADNENVRVVNTAGITVFTGKLNDFKATAPMGVYIVVEAGKAYKMVVK